MGTRSLAVAIVLGLWEKTLNWLAGSNLSRISYMLTASVFTARAPWLDGILCLSFFRNCDIILPGL